MFEWSERTGLLLRFIMPGKPVQNAFIERVNGELGGECGTPNGIKLCATPREEITKWRVHDTTGRPRLALGYRTSIEALRDRPCDRGAGRLMADTPPIPTRDPAAGQHSTAQNDRNHPA